MSSWAREAWILLGIIIASLLLGAITRHPLGILTVGVLIYLASTLRHLHQLHRWLQNQKQGEVPDAGGVWGDVFNDIRRLERDTQRRKDRLTGMLERFQAASAALPDAVVILSQTDEIEWANPAAERLLGVHWPRDHAQRVVNLLRNPDFTEYLREGEFNETLTIPSPVLAGYTLSVQITPFGSSQKLLTFRDVTHLARLEEMRRHFVANVSHELRTPVTVLLGFLETLKDMPAWRPEDLRGPFAAMYDQAQRMQRMLDDLLTLSKLETSPAHLHDEAIDVSEMLSSVKEVGELLSGGQQRLSLEIEPGLLLSGNREELRSAFSNLVNNAVRYTPAGGEIRLHWFSDAEGAKFAVTDTGEGIAPHHIPHLTERFYRVDTGRSRATGGTGLGLSIVKHILLRHEAHLAIQSQLGKGSTFTCIFPRSRIVSRAAASAAS
jgi:two-component system phosphate regulon sensor histidine kinase PhoR